MHEMRQRGGKMRSGDVGSEKERRCCSAVFPPGDSDRGAPPLEPELTTVQ